MKTIHNEYNNIYYWTNDFVEEKTHPTLEVGNLDTIVDAEQWLE